MRELNKICLICGKEFEVKNNQAKKKYCSNECYKKATYSFVKHDEAECEICHKTFVKLNCMQKCCSPECSAEKQRIRSRERARKISSGEIASVKRKCKYCGKLFEAKTSRVCCSDECARLIKVNAENKKQYKIKNSKKHILSQMAEIAFNNGSSYGKYYAELPRWSEMRELNKM